MKSLNPPTADLEIGACPASHCPDSSVGRASAFGAGGRGFESWPHHTKGVKNSTSSSLADACIKRGCARKIE